MVEDDEMTPEIEQMANALIPVFVLHADGYWTTDGIHGQGELWTTPATLAAALIAAGFRAPEPVKG